MLDESFYPKCNSLNCKTSQRRFDKKGRKQYGYVPQGERVLLKRFQHADSEWLGYDKGNGLLIGYAIVDGVQLFYKAIGTAYAYDWLHATKAKRRGMIKPQKWAWIVERSTHKVVGKFYTLEGAEKACLERPQEFITISAGC